MNMPSPLLSPFLFLPGLIMEGAVRARSNLYSRGVFKRHRLPNPVISIGNITLGGSGKTPLVYHTASVLHELGACSALLSRGYGRRGIQEAHILPPGNEIPAPALNLGDEPALVRRRHPETWLGISKNRYEVACRMLERRSDLVFILDDGFQHSALDRTLDILVIDCTQPLTENRVFPRGTLREPLTSMKRAHTIVLTMGACSRPPREIEIQVRRYNPGAPILHCRQRIDSIFPFASWKQQAVSNGPVPMGGSAFVVSAIGNPGRFRRDVEDAGIVVRGSRSYRDHYRLKSEDWVSCTEEAARSGADFLLTTEKDAIKIPNPPRYPLMIAVQSVQFLQEQEFCSILKQAIGGTR